MVRFYGGEEASEGELRPRLERHGLAATRIEEEGCLLMRQERTPFGGRKENLKHLFEESW